MAACDQARWIVKRPTVAVLLALAVIAGMMATLVVTGSRSTAIAQDDAAAKAAHPIVGSWQLTVDARDPADPPVLVVYHADGSYTDSAVGRSGGVGVWEPIDDRSVATNVVFHAEDESGKINTTRIRTVSTVDHYDEQPVGERLYVRLHARSDRPGRLRQWRDGARRRER